MFFRLTLLQALTIILIPALVPHSNAYGQGSPNVTLLDNVNDYPATGYNDCWGYAANGREYALLGVKNGTSIIEITDSGSAAEVAFFSSAFSTWKDIKTYQNFAYVVTESGGGMQIIDLTDLPNSATLVNTYTGFLTSHDIYIDEPNAMLYAEGSGGVATRAISLADPVNPVEVSTFGLNNHDMYARDNIVYVAEGSPGSIGIFDLTNPFSPTFLARFPVPGGGFAHNCWLSDDGNFLITTQETTNRTVKVFDIQDFNNAFVTDDYLGPSNLAHNAAFSGNFAYISHYADGLRILDVSNPANIFEAGYYDTSPSGGGFNGAWGVFPPLLSSGKILISDIQSGLYVFSFDAGTPTDMSFDLTPNNPPITISSGGGSFQYDVLITNNTTAVQSFDFWNEIITPSGNKIGPTLGPFNLDFEVGSPFSKTNINQNVPGGAPGGTYTFIFSVGDFPNRPLAVDSFTFDKSGGPAKSSGAGETDWKASWDADTGRPVIAEETPASFILGQNYPNPFNPSTTVSYQLPRAEKVEIIIYDLAGRHVRELVNETKNAGSYTVLWDGKNGIGQPVASGLYIYQIRAGQFSHTRKMLLLK